MTIVDKFTSTGAKFFNHLDRLQHLKNGNVYPIVAHIMPTSLCNLNCSYCSIKSRPKEELDFDEIKKTTIELLSHGLRAVILSGGGEPLIYKHFDELVEFLHHYKLEIGLITNGTLLKHHDVSKFTWVRVSINPETINNLDLPEIPGTLGFSYIVSGETEEMLTESIKKIIKLVDKYNPEYVRVLSDCAISNEDILQNQILIKKVVDKFPDYKDVFFQQYKLPSSPDKCYLGYLHPVIYCDGYVYPCDSLVLNDHKVQKFKDKYRICSMKDLTPLLDTHIIKSLVNPKRDCPNCVFRKQNQLLDSILNPPEVHKNFI